MTRKGIHEYAAALRPRYQLAGRKAKAAMLAEFCQTTGYHHKAAIRLLRHCPAGAGRAKKKPQPVYGSAVAQALKIVWEAADCICSKRLAPFLAQLVPILEQHGELKLEARIREQLLRVSPSTMDRLLKAYRMPSLRRPYTQSSAANSIKDQVPVRTFGDWEGVQLGSMQADLVAHCGESTEGFYLNSLMVVDVRTGWVGLQPIWGKGQERVGAGIHKMRKGLPFGLRELHTDNGGEFLNRVLFPYCQREGIHLTRGRSYRKNDQAYVEQKNWSVVRQQVGYDRYCTKKAYTLMQRLYPLIEDYTNFFQPISKLLTKERTGAKVKKTYDTAQTPYQRLLATDLLDEAQRQALERKFGKLNPVQLLSQIRRLEQELWEMASKSSTSAPSSEEPEEEVASPLAGAQAG